MDFLSFLERDDLAAEAGLTPTVCRRAAPALQLAPSLAAVLADGPTDALSGLTPDELRAIGSAHRRWREWKDALSAFSEDDPIHTLAAQITTRPDQLRVLAGADTTPKLAPRLLELWESSMELAREDGSAPITRGDKLTQKASAKARPAAGREGPFADLVGKRLPLADLQAKTWLAVRHGARRGILSYTLSLPTGMLRAKAREQGAESLFEDAVLPALKGGLRGFLDAEAQETTIRMAADRYLGVLRARPVRSDRIVAVYVGRARDPVGLVLLDREGNVILNAVLQPGPDWGQRLERFLREQRPEHGVLPSEAPAVRLLAEVARRLPPRLPTTRVRRAALDLARRTLPNLPEGLPPVVQAAAALGRRAIDPSGEWSRLDAAELALVPHMGDLDPEAVREGLLEARLSRAAGAPPRPARAAAPTGVGPADAQQPAGGGGGRRRGGVEAPRARTGRSRPPIQRRPVQVVGEEVEVKTLQDLRAGMIVKGTVTNTSRFGAFVSIGLQEEGLIHVSELADHYVADPAEVVSVGQDLTARILQVDAERRRVSLSLKGVEEETGEPAVVPRAQSEQHGSGAGGGGGTSGGVPQNRSEALAELNRLFSKE